MKNPGWGWLIGLSLVLLMAGGVLAGAKQWVEHGSGTINGPITGDYMFYGGDYYRSQGTPDDEDAKISMSMNGKMAADMYRFMGKAAQLPAYYNCSNFERREKGDLACKRNKKTGQTFCHVHINLKTGQANLMLGC